MTKRPHILLDDMVVGGAPEPSKGAGGEPQERQQREHYRGQRSSYDPDVMRSSFYCHRAVHDVLREIAYVDRVSISSLIMRGLDHVLSEKGQPDTATLIAEFRAKHPK